MTRIRAAVAMLVGWVLAAPLASARQPPADAPAWAAKELRAGIIGTDTSHVPQFVKTFRSHPEWKIRIVAAFKGGSPDLPLSANRLEGFAKTIQAEGVEIVDSVVSLLKRVDVVLLTSVDGRPHLAQARPVFEAGKRVFIDKPLAASLDDARQIAALSRQTRTPFFSASSVRFHPEIPELRKNARLGRFEKVEATYVLNTIEFHPDLFYYGIHGVEALYAVMGTGCASLSRRKEADVDVTTCTWRDGRVGIYRGLPKADPKQPLIRALGGNRTAETTGAADSEAIARAIAEFFHTGRSPVDVAETIEVIEFMTAAQLSKERGGAEVKLAELRGSSTRQPRTQAPAAATTSIAIIPQPVSVTPRTGRFQLAPKTVIWTDRASVSIGHQLARYLEPATGFILRVQTTGNAPAGAIQLRRDPALKRLGPEGYTLDVRAGRVVALAPELAGLFHAVQTLRQLLPPESFREAPSEKVDWSMPAVTIEDMPRFGWRGAHLDVGRHFMPKEFVKKYIDLLALHKLNTFHWHLTDDQGWRLEIKQYPRLTAVGSCRKETLVGRYVRDEKQWKFDGTPHCGFYTQDDAREIVAYAKARFIEVVPEIEMPGHAVAAIAAYPELGVTGTPMDVATRWGIFSDILNAEPATIAFMQNVLTEVTAIFPSRYIHIGGDEADKAKWKASPRIQARIKELGLADEHALQSWFVRQMDTFLTSKGRRLVGWDEILEGGLAENAVVMSWRGLKGGIEAARARHDVVMAPTSHTYLDYYQSKDQAREPLAIGGFLPLETVYAYEPVPAELEPQFARHVLGAQAQLWTEYLPSPKRVEYMAFPRLTALAEVVWTARERKDYADYLLRLEPHLQRLAALDVNFRPLDK